ncbi:MAG: PilW family protein [Candidatus Nealsonbacteria bacterium]
MKYEEIKRSTKYEDYNPPATSSHLRWAPTKKKSSDLQTSDFRLQKSFTLTELLVTITILILVIGAIYGTYILSHRTYREEEIAAELTQNGRVILERLTREIRQAQLIATDLASPKDEILFQDGHLSSISEEDIAQGGGVDGEGVSYITLASTASDEKDFYKDMFIEIIGGTGKGQIRKIVSYNETNQKAEVDSDWDTNPNDTSEYKIDTSYYYIHYYLDTSNNIQNIQRKVITYCISEDSTDGGCQAEASCKTPGTYASRDATPDTGAGECLLEVILEELRVIGEYVDNLEFWGSEVINIALTLTKGGKTLKMETKIFGRNF